MKIKAKKRDLENAIQVATIGVAGGTEDGVLEAHYLIRIRDGGVQILANNKQRLLTSATVAGATVEEGDEGASFTVPGWRMRQWLGAIEDGDEELGLSLDNGVVKATSRRGSGKFGSLNPKDFPFWDDTLAQAKSVAKVSSARLSGILAYSRSFVSDQETRSPALVATECRAGTLNATDSVGVSMVTTPALAESSLRIHGKDISPVISFLSLKGSDEVEILEHDRCLFLKRADGSLLGVSRWMHDFPNLNIDRKGPDKCWFSVSTADLTGAIKFLCAFAKKDDVHLQFRFDPAGKIVLSMEPGSGSSEPDEQVIACVEHEAMDLLKSEGYDGFTLSKRYVENIASAFGQETLRFGVNWAKRNGYVTFRHERDEDEYFTLVVWIRKQ